MTGAVRLFAESDTGYSDACLTRPVEQELIYETTTRLITEREEKPDADQ